LFYSTYKNYNRQQGFENDTANQVIVLIEHNISIHTGM